MAGWRRRTWWLAVVLAAVLVLGLWRRLYVDHRPLQMPPVTVDIAAGSSLEQAARTLQKAGLLRVWELRLVERIEGGGRNIKAGSYDLARGLSPASILQKLVQGEVVTIPVTVAEGWTNDQVSRVVTDSLGVDAARFDSLTAHPAKRWRDALALPEEATLEGYLFPETYRFARGIDADTVVAKLVETALAVATDSLRARADSLGLTWHAAVTLASIIEAETSVPTERTLVSAVYHNRLREGWKLEADPTVAYAVDKVGQPLTYGDLQAESAYNTYRNPGLPPGPINNPGRASIVAALFPQPGFAAMYFVADGKGGHVFSRTWEEHRSAVREYRRRRDAGRK